MWEFKEGKLHLDLGKQKIEFRLTPEDLEQLELMDYDFDLQTSIHQVLVDARESFKSGRASYKGACQNLTNLLEEVATSIELIFNACLKHLSFFVLHPEEVPILQTWFQTVGSQILVDRTRQYIELWRKVCQDSTSPSPSKM